MPKHKTKKKKSDWNARRMSMLRGWITKAKRVIGKGKHMSGGGIFDQVMLPEIRDSQMISKGLGYAGDNALGYVPLYGNILRGAAYLGQAGAKAMGYGRKRRSHRMRGRGAISDAVKSRSGQFTIGRIASMFA